MSFFFLGICGNEFTILSSLNIPKHIYNFISSTKYVVHLDGTLKHQVWWEVALPLSGGLELGDPKAFYDSMIIKPMFIEMQ